MVQIVTRETGATAKNSPLTNAELDTNFINLNTSLESLIAATVTNGIGAQTPNNVSFTGGTLTGVTLDDVNALIGADHLHVKIKATQALVKGDLLKVTGFNSGENAFEVATAVPGDIVFAICYQNLAIGALGAAINTGLLEGIDTSAYAVGTILYANNATFTSTKPSSGSYQTLAYVLRSHAINGSIYFEASAPRFVESSLETANTVAVRSAGGTLFAKYLAIGDNFTDSSYISARIQSNVTGDATNTATYGININPIVNPGGSTHQNIRGCATIKANTTLETFTYYNIAPLEIETNVTINNWYGVSAGGIPSGKLVNTVYRSTLGPALNGTLTSYKVETGVCTVYSSSALTSSFGNLEVGQEIIIYSTTLPLTVSGRRTVTSVAADLLSFSFNTTEPDTVLTTLGSRYAGYCSLKARNIDFTGGAPCIFNGPIDIAIGSGARTPALRIFNSGLGASFIVEDAASDPSVFVIDDVGNVIIGDRVTRSFAHPDNNTNTPSLTNSAWKFNIIGTNHQTACTMQALFANTASGPTKSFYKTRKTTLNDSAPVSTDKVQPDDTLGTICFMADDGASQNGVESAKIETRVVGSPTTGVVQSITRTFSRQSAGSSRTLQNYYPTSGDSHRGFASYKSFTNFGNSFSIGYDLSKTTEIFETSLNIDTNITGFCFANNGTKLFVTGFSGDAIREYNVPTPYSLIGITFVQFVLTGRLDPRGLAISSDGTRIFVSDATTDIIDVFSLPTPYSLTGASLLYSISTLTLFGQTASIAANSLYFSEDGLNVYTADPGLDRVFQAKLTVPFDLNTGTYYSQSPSFANSESTLTGFCLNSKGTVGFIVGITLDTVFQVMLDVPFDVSTMTVRPEVFQLPASRLNPYCIVLNDTLDKLYISSTTSDDIVEYQLYHFANEDYNEQRYYNRVEFLSRREPVIAQKLLTSEYSAMSQKDGQFFYNESLGKFVFRENGKDVKIALEDLSPLPSLNNYPMLPSAGAAVYDTPYSILLTNSGNVGNNATLSLGTDGTIVTAYSIYVPITTTFSELMFENRTAIANCDIEIGIFTVESIANGYRPGTLLKGFSASSATTGRKSSSGNFVLTGGTFYYIIISTKMASGTNAGVNVTAMSTSTVPGYSYLGLIDGVISYDNDGAVATTDSSCKQWTAVKTVSQSILVNSPSLSSYQSAANVTPFAFFKY